jgi:phosphoglycolate phosphatase-like HAD superfamily hydrolase
MLKKLFVTFDIDGTIFSSVNSGHIQYTSIFAAFQEFLGREPLPIMRPEKGMTDSALVRANFIHQGIFPSDPDVRKLLLFYDKCFINHRIKGGRPLQGVHQAVQTLKSLPNVWVGIATGCTYRTALHRLKSANLVNLFSPMYGGFGENLLRYECILKAKRVLEEARSIKVDEVLHIGDTPADVFAAKQAGCHSLAVLTGKFTEHEFPAGTRFVKNLKVGLDDLKSIVSDLRT